MIVRLRGQESAVMATAAPAFHSARVVFDVSTSMRWTGPPVGIVRVERELARWALMNVPNVTFVFFDPQQKAYYELKTNMMRAFLDGEALLATFGLPGSVQSRRRKTDRAPAALRPFILWIGQARRMLLGRLEVVRLGTAPPRLRRLAGWLQEPLMSKKYRAIMVEPNGKRRPFLPYQAVFGAVVELLSNDTLVCAGAGWAHTDIDTIRSAKLRSNFSFVILCHDLIPILFPHFYPKHDVDQFRTYMQQALPIADVIAVTSRTTEQDCRTYFSQRKSGLGKIVIAPLGHDAGGHPLHIPSLPNGLAPGRFVLMVSTIEPRKGHHLLYNVWRRLVSGGVIKSTGFKLVFVGRPGWMVDDLLAGLQSDPAISNQILTMSDVDDNLLRALYEGAAFCVYPSRYEGYGLPICEAFSHGKPVLASTGGAIPEIVQGLCPCLDPENEEVWYDWIRKWIEHPHLRDPFERAIRQNFKHPTWSEAAANFFESVIARAGSSPSAER